MHRWSKQARDANPTRPGSAMPEPRQSVSPWRQIWTAADVNRRGDDARMQTKVKFSGIDPPAKIIGLESTPRRCTPHAIKHATLPPPLGLWMKYADKTLRPSDARGLPVDRLDGVPESDGSVHPVWIVQRTISGRWVVERPHSPLSARFAERSEAVAYAYAESRRLGRGRIVVLPVRVRARNFYPRRDRE